MKNLFKEIERAKAKLLKASEKYFKVSGMLPVYFIEWKYKDEMEYTKTYFFKEEDAQKVRARFESNPEIKINECGFIKVLAPSWYL